MRPRVLAPALLALAATLIAAAPAAAEFSPIRLLSKSSTEQADRASGSVLSGDGRYIAFQASIGRKKGIFREEVATGALLPVITVSTEEATKPGSEGRDPSISANGRYVAFTTEIPLDPVDDLQPESSDVYLADLASSPPSYELASALDGCNSATSPTSCGLSYEGNGGSQASGGVALSADGRRLVFVIAAVSDLGGTAGDTPAGQVVLRDLDSDRTTLVSVARDQVTGAMQPGVPVAAGAVPDSFQPLSQGAALSADGTTVAWPGAHLPAQVPLLADERATVEVLDTQNGNHYSEPLWRRVVDGPGAPTRRIVGGGDPLAPGCPGTSGIFATPACRGPFPGITNKNTGTIDAGTGWMGVPNVDGVPRLSADGRMVALIGNPTEAANVFLVDMAPGLSRVQALRPLTREIQVNSAEPSAGVGDLAYVPLNGHAFDLAFAADGRRIALATARQRFPLAPPNLVGAAPTSVGLVELYLIDLDGQTLRRVTHGFGGVGEASLPPPSVQENATNGLGATSLTLDADGDEIGFSSAASNLVPGDGNDAGDIFLVHDDRLSSGVASVAISPGPKKRKQKRRWALTLSAVSLPNGSVRLVAFVPGPGKLRARAKGSLRAEERPRSLDLEQARAKKPGKRRLVLKLPRQLGGLARTREGVYAMAHVSFRRKGRKVLREELQVRFHVHAARKTREGGR